MNVQANHVHLLAMVPPKVLISDYLGTIRDFQSRPLRDRIKAVLSVSEIQLS